MDPEEHSVLNSNMPSLLLYRVYRGKERKLWLIFHSISTKASINIPTTKCVQQGEHTLFLSKCKLYVHMHTHQEDMITHNVIRNSNSLWHLNPKCMCILRTIFHPQKDTHRLHGLPFYWSIAVKQILIDFLTSVVFGSSTSQWEHN